MQGGSSVGKHISPCYIWTGKYCSLGEARIEV